VPTNITVNDVDTYIAHSKAEGHATATTQTVVGGLTKYYIHSHNPKETQQ